MLNTVNLFIALVVAAITYGTPLLFGTLGEVLTEKSGSLNLGVEGIMFMGGAIGLGGVFYYEKAVESPSAFLAVLIGLLCAFIAGGIASLIFSFLTISVHIHRKFVFHVVGGNLINIWVVFGKLGFIFLCFFDLSRSYGVVHGALNKRVVQGLFILTCISAAHRSLKQRVSAVSFITLLEVFASAVV